jgi:N-acetylmuramic acid 6-phosphate etherase
VNVLARKSDRALFATLQSLTTEARNPRTMGIDLASSEEILQLIHEEDRSVADRVREAIPQLARIVDRVSLAFGSGSSLYYAGAGTSGRLGVLDAAECPPTFGTPPEQVVGLIAGGHETLVRSREGVEDSAEEGERAVDEHRLGEGDVLVGISASRRTPYVHGALKRARERGAWTAFLACNQLAAEERDCAHCVVEVVVGPEAITGSTRMKSALAQKMMLTMISTASMVRSGKVYENLMVDVAPTSQKLVERAKGLVMQLGGVDYDEAGVLLESAGYQVKPAVVMAVRGVSLEDAREALAASQGLLRRALQEEDES